MRFSRLDRPAQLSNRLMEVWFRCGSVLEPGKAQSRAVIQEDTMATLQKVQKVADQVYRKCKHVTEDGIDALEPIGKSGEGYWRCIICNEVICTEPLDDEEPPARYGL